MIRILLVGKRKQPITWAAIYLMNKHHLARFRMLDGVRRVIKLLYGPIRYYDFPWEKRFNVYNAMYRSDPEVWAKYMERRLRKLSRGVVVDDPHYINEVEYLQRLGFIIVRIDMRTDLKIAIGRALLDSEVGTVLLQEHFGNPPAYKADYVLSVSDRQGLYRALDELMEKLKLIDPIVYNDDDELLVEPFHPSMWEGVPATWSEVYANEEKVITPNESID